MFAKSPDPRCATGSKFFTAIQNVHQKIGDLALSAVSGQRITITGIGFFDFLSNERGQAPNGVELHPLLSICAGIDCAIAPPKSGAPPVFKPFPIGSSPVPKSKRSPPPTHGIANGATSSDDPAVVSYESVIQGEGASQFAELDETSGTTATFDFTSSIGTYIGADVLNYAAGPIVGSTANSVRISGGTASIGVAMPSAGWVAGNSFTIETWVKPTLKNGYSTIWGADGSRRLLISSAGRLLSQFGGANFLSTSALANNAWSLVDYVYNAATGQASYYINGVLDSTSPPIATSAEHLATYYLGQYDTSANYKYVGQIADVALYPSALSGSQIATNYTAAGFVTPTPTPSPSAQPDDPAVVSYESVIQGEGASQFAELDETSGTTATFDFTSSIGTYIGADVLNYAAGPIVGSTANSVKISGGTASIGVAMPSAGWVAGNSFTIETWVKPSGAYITIWGADGSRRLLISAGRKLLSQFGGANFFSTSALANNAWSLVDYVYNAATGQASYYINGVLDSTSPPIATSAEHLSTYYLGQYDTSANYKYVGQIADVALYPSALSGTQIATNYGAAVAAKPGVDWNTFGFDLYRTGYNPSESVIGAGNVGSLHPLWASSASVGGSMVGEPVLATHVMINHIPTNVLYAGGAFGTALHAINADNGATIWTHPMGTSARMCGSGTTANYGILDTATIDRATNRIYIADGQDQLHALDLATGAEAGGWPITVAADPIHNAVWAGLTYNPANGLIYVETASEGCDVVPWQGRIVAINTSTATIVGTFYPAQGNNGGGVWGYGGASIDPVTNNVFIATGNSAGSSQTLGYSEQIIELSPDVSTVLANNYPNLPAVGDADFGATPLLFQPPGCPPLLAAVNKSGIFVLYSRGNISAGPIQTIAMSIVSGAHLFVGVPAYDPTTNYIYVGLPTTFGIYKPGLGAFSMQADCTLNPTPVWNALFGPDGSPRSALTVANGVVYVSNYSGKTEYAFDTANGAQLWSTTLKGYGVPGAIVANGHLYVSDYNGNIMEWGP